MAKKILITGASGLIGTLLTEILLSEGLSVSHLGRTKKEGKVPSFIWDIDSGGIDTNSLKEVDAVVHLAGAGVADKRWTAKRKKEILESRIKSTDLLFRTLKNSSHTIKAFISASAIGYYGFDDDDKIFTENDLPAKDFLAKVTQQWENEVDKIKLLDLRVVKLRLGIVLSEKGGALKEIAKPIKLGVGASLGSGKQCLSWIHIRDLCGMFVKAIEDEKMSGAYNATTDWCTNKEMTQSIAKILNRSLWLPAIPSFILKIMLGEMSDMVLKGSKVSSEKIRRAGFQSKFNNLENSIKDLMTISLRSR